MTMISGLFRLFGSLVYWAWVLFWVVAPYLLILAIFAGAGVVAGRLLTLMAGGG